VRTHACVCACVFGCVRVLVGEGRKDSLAARCLNSAWFFHVGRFGEEGLGGGCKGACCLEGAGAPSRRHGAQGLSCAHKR